MAKIEEPMMDDAEPTSGKKSTKDKVKGGPKVNKTVTNKPRIPSDEELAKWEKEAGAPKLITSPEGNTVTPVGSDEVDLNSVPAGTPMSQGMTQPDNHLRPKIHRLLGQEGHAEVYAKWRMANPTHVGLIGSWGTYPKQGTIEDGKAEWHAMPDSSKWAWQQTSEGAKATSDAIKEAESSYTQSAGAARDERYRDKTQVRRAFFPSDEAQKAFSENGTLARSGNIEDVANVNDPIQKAALGLPRTEPENNWRKVWAVNVRPGERRGVGLALHQDPSHFEALDNHINDLVTRPLHGDMKMSRRIDGLPSFDTSNMRSIPVRGPFDQIGDRFPASNGGYIMQGKQFDTRGIEGLHAKEYLAKAAMAHSIGDHDAALRYFSKATDHAANLANINNEINRTRGANVGKYAEADEDKGDDILTSYRRSIEHRR